MTPWLALVAAGLATSGLVDVLKELPPAGLPRPLKPLAAATYSAALVWPLLYHQWRVALLVWLGAWGLSRLIHALVSALQALKDRNRIEVATEVAKRRRTAPRR